MKKFLSGSLLIFSFLVAATFFGSIATETVSAAETNTRQNYFKFEYENPIEAKSFTKLLQGILAQIYAIVGWLAVIMIVIGGIMYLTSAGKSGQMELAKKIIIYSLIGFAVAVAAPTLLREIRDLAVESAKPGQSDLIEKAPKVADILEEIMNFVLTAVGVLAIIAFVASGIMFIAAGGNPTSASNAKKAMVYSIIGVAVAGGGLIIIRQILALLG